MNSKNAIEVRNMSKSFKVNHDKANTLKGKMIFWNRGKTEIHPVLNNINVDIKKGETVALIGVNGSGKSTLLKLMTRIIFPNQGTIQLDGKVTSLLELGAGFHPDFTGRENIYFNASIFGLTRREIDRRVDAIVAFSELGEFIDNPIRTYSSGMYMRLAFSVAINVDADILLIDEILAVGDQHFQDKCYAKLRQLRDAGKTIVIVTHSLGVVRELCHRAVWIYKGELKLDGDPTYVIEEYLKQVALDHKEKQKNEKNHGEHVDKAVVFIDRPKDFAEIVASDRLLLCGGWSVSNVNDAYLKAFVDDCPVAAAITHFSRPDVYEAYYEEYGADLDADRIGWNLYLDPKEMDKGHHVFKMTCLTKDGAELASKDITFELK